MNKDTKTKELEKLARKGNIFAKYQQIYDKTGLPVNLKALMKKEDCKHFVKLGIAEFRLTAITEPQIKDGFEIREEICLHCGKTVKIHVRKPKEPQRLTRWTK